jgi:prenyltransferase beta subunit
MAFSTAMGSSLAVLAPGRGVSVVVTCSMEVVILVPIFGNYQTKGTSGQKSELQMSSDSSNPSGNGGYSQSLRDQLETLESILPLLESVSCCLTKDQNLSFELFRHQHSEFLWKPLESGLPSSFVSLDASKPWILFWITQSLSLLEDSGSTEDTDTVKRYIFTSC